MSDNERGTATDGGQSGQPEESNAGEQRHAGGPAGADPGGHGGKTDQGERATERETAQAPGAAPRASDSGGRASIGAVDAPGAGGDVGAVEPAEFASVVAHDVNNQLNVALGRLELVDGGDPEARDQVRAALVRAEGILDEMLAYASEDRQVEEVQSVRLDATAVDAWEAIGSDSARLRVTTRRRVLADRDALQRLFENLLRNAVQHAGPDATVVVGDIDRPARDPDRETTGFYVEDDGTGIPLEERDSVFDPWTSTGDDAMGFGLTIVARVAEAHGWDVLATDGIAGGARIEVTDVGTAGT